MNFEDCGICGESLSSKYVYKLDCNHSFHYTCLMESFNNHKKNKCPYCRTRCGYLPPVNGLKKLIPAVHYGDYETKHNLEESYENIKCEYIFIKGKNKGGKCGKNCKIGYNTCILHYKP